MATIILTASAARLNEATEAIASTYNYQTTIEDGLGGQIPNPETKAVFAKRMIIEEIRQKIRVWREKQALAVVPPVENDIT